MESSPEREIEESEATQIDLPGAGSWKKPIKVHEVSSENSPQNGLSQVEAGKGPSRETEHINSFNEWTEHGFT